MMNRKILKASAGTGKTYRLSIEYIASLLNNENFENILVMTFTKKATAEIRERILEHLELITNNFPEGEEILNNIIKLHPEIKINKNKLEYVYKEILKNKEKIKIYTIDSFTNLLFKKAVAPHLNIYNYEIISDNKNREYVQQLFEKIINNRSLFNQIKHFFLDNAEKDIDAYFEIINSILNSRWKFLLINRKERTLKTNTDYFIPLEEGINILKEIAKLKEKEDEFDTFLSKDFKKYYCMDISSKKKFIEDNHKLFFNSSALKFWNGVKTRGKNVAGLKEQMEDYFLDFKGKLAAHVYNHFIIPFEDQLFDFSNMLFDLYDNIKLFEKKFTHTDISTYTYKYFYDEKLNLIKQNKVTDYFHQLIGGNISTVFIDEFQDTSILQWKILNPILDSAEYVICVGDSKQSIYGWRGGEKKLFDNLENIIRDADNEFMDISYRSQKNIIKFINSFFHKNSELWEYSSVKHLPQKNQGYVYTYIENKDTEISSINKMVDILKSEITNYSNVGIVARTKKQLNIIAETLNEENIPFITNDGNCIVEHKALKGVYSFLKFLTYGDYFYLIELLRSDIINIEEESLKEMIIHSSDIIDYLNYKNDSLDIIQNLPLKQVLAFVKGFKKKELLRFKIESEKGARLDNLAKSIIEELKLTEIFSSNSDRKNIYKFYELIRNFNDLNSFINFVEENRDEEALKQVAIEEQNAVKLMTIHKSKGLEFETEFLYWELTSNRNYDKGLKFYLELDEMFTNTKDYLLTNTNYSNILNHLNLDFKSNENIKEQIEEINNLYVAITRPKKNLFLFLNTKTKADKLNKKENFFLKGLKKSFLNDDLNEISEKSIGKFYESPNKIENVEKSNIEDINFKEWFENTELNSEVQSQTIFRKQNTDYKMSIEKEIKRKTGLAIHEYLMFIKYATIDEMDLAKMKTISKYGNMFGMKKIDSIIKRVEKFIEKYKNHKIHGNIFNTKFKIFTEYEIFDENDSNRTKYIIDRLMIDEEKKIVFIYDFKTGGYKEEQLELYKKIVQQKVDETYSIMTGEDYYLIVE